MLQRCANSPEHGQPVKEAIISSLPQDISGQQFGRWYVVRRAPSRGTEKSYHYWFCRCSCGTEREVIHTGIRYGHSKSCGCLQKERSAQTAAKTGWKHGGHGTPEYRVYGDMLSRCHNPNHASFLQYGGRGITVCARWRSSFTNFLTDMGPRPSKTHSIERLDNNGSYTPENCVWGTPKQQSRNRRVSNLITYNGETLCLSEWAERLGICRATLNSRLFIYEWSAERAFSEPVQSLNSRREQVAKLTIEDARIIRRRIARGTHTRVELAKEFSVTYACIRDIVTGKTWRE